MNKNRVLITTTNAIENVEIKHYKGVVSARVVAGTGYFSDLFAGFSDIFGGRSGTYQRQLKSLYDEVIENLSNEARKIGANAIVGVNMDNDEISGKGKQMFMVTATGTAVTVPEQELEKMQGEEVEELLEISSEKFDSMYNRLRIITLIRNDPSEIENHWDYIVNHSVFEVMEYVYKRYSNETISFQIFKERTIAYFSQLEEGVAISFLYKKFDSSTRNSRLISLLHGAKLVHYQSILNSFPQSSENMKICLFHLSYGDKRVYKREDIQRLAKLIEVFEKGFPEQLGAKQNDNWICSCGNKNKSGQNYCKRCEKDARGFLSTDVNYDYVIRLLKEREYVLKKIFKVSVE
ncbi:YbjQ family protein [Paenibacillus sp. HB172176]|uniref:YbjQ family protein n=1 Tax=Paenibacillus sp. HB172176 TaxID=2493690 RepID=UPI00143BA76A|nr:YbjQ family protein [Paenibacillus sp. HB172176]